MSGIIDRIKGLFGGASDTAGDTAKDGEVAIDEAELDDDSSYDRVQADIARNKQEAFDRLSDMDNSRR